MLFCNLSIHRKEGGINVILEAINKLSLVHPQHIAYYDPKGGKVR